MFNVYRIQIEQKEVTIEAGFNLGVHMSKYGKNGHLS